MTKQNSIGIIGVGFVGGAVKYWFDSKPQYPLFVYDKFKKMGSVVEVNKADIIFVCVPTPYGKKGYDDSAVLEALKNIKVGKIVIIKSTIVPGSTDRYQKIFPKLKLLFNPEFLVAKNANQDFVKPDRQIVGYTRQSKAFAREVLNVLPPAPFVKTVRAIDAEMIKYFGNTFLATRVVFANQMYDLCEIIGADYETVKESASADARIGASHFTIFHDGYRGYAGACLPKDTRAIIQFGKKMKNRMKLLERVEEINNDLIKKSER